MTRPTGHRIPPELLGSDGAAAERTPVRAAEPSHAERARTIVAGIGRASLATVGQEPAGYPFVSAVNVVFDGAGRPVTFLSTMAVHTQNLTADPRASLLVTEVTPEGGDQLAEGRVTVVGDMVRLERGTPDEAEARERFLAVHPQSFYLDYGDFGAYRLEPSAVRYVGGFGRMSWVDVAAYQRALPDPLAAVAAGAIAHMNGDHADALAACAQAFAGVPATSAVMTALDRYGFDLVAQTPEGRRAVRVGFDEPLDSGDQVRPAMVAMVGHARSLADSPPPGGRDTAS